MARSSLRKGTAAPPGVSRPGPPRNRSLPPVWTARREGAPSLPLCVSSPLSLPLSSFFFHFCPYLNGRKWVFDETGSAAISTRLNQMHVTQQNQKHWIMTYFNYLPYTHKTGLHCKYFTSISGLWAYICPYLLILLRLCWTCHSSPWWGEDCRQTHISPACSQHPGPPAEGTAEGEEQGEPAGQEWMPAAGQGLRQEWLWHWSVSCSREVTALCVYIESYLFTVSFPSHSTT